VSQKSQHTTNNKSGQILFTLAKKSNEWLQNTNANVRVRCSFAKYTQLYMPFVRNHYCL